MNGEYFQAANRKALGLTRAEVEVWSVSQVNALVRRLLEDSVPHIWVAGEVSGFKRYAAGHCFFTLKDKWSQINCVMWREAARSLPSEPPEGMAVHALGYPSVYERSGRFQLIVQQLAERGAGLWRLALERVRKKLEAEGLFDPARKRPLPAFPRCVGVVTSMEGAAIRDVVSIIRRRAPWTDILIYPARVQGDGAAATIVAAIRGAGRARRADVLIVGRGGGSLEDLRAFNEESVVRAIARAPMPVVSAVGHETDVTLVDLAADRRAPTPSAAAELAVPEISRVRAELQSAAERMTAALRGLAGRHGRRLEVLEARLIEALRGGLEHRRLTLAGLGQRLHALGPISVLRRGYALALDDDGVILRSIDEFRPGMEFNVRLSDGTVRARTESVPDDADGGAMSSPQAHEP